MLFVLNYRLKVMKSFGGNGLYYYTLLNYVISMTKHISSVRIMGTIPVKFFKGWYTRVNQIEKCMLVITDC